MQALVLVGGKGTRLRPLTNEVPKPVLPLVDRPFLSYMVEWLGSHGITDVVMACGFAADELQEALSGSREGGPTVRFVSEPEPRGTAGAIKFAASELEDRFCALNGDVLTDLDLSGLISQHERTGARATLGLHPVEDPSRFGLVRRRESGEVSEFLEKPDPEEIDTDEINAGMYVLEREVLDLVPEGRECSIEREVFPKLVGDGLFGRRLEGYWTDIGTPETYLRATWDIVERRVQTRVGRMLGSDRSWVAPGADVDPSATIDDSVVVLEGARVGPDATIGPRAVIGSGCRVGPGATVRGSVLHAACRIGAGVTVEGSILGRDVEVLEGTEATDAVLAAA